MDTRQAAEATGFSSGKISNIEVMKVAVNGDDTYTLCQAYGAPAQTTEALVRLAREARRKGWWAVYDDDVLGTFGDFMELEEDAATIFEFEADVIPGLLQSERYAAAVIGRARPAVGEEAIKEKVALRMQRKDRLMSSSATELSVVIDEAALRRPVGGREVMAEQLTELADMAKHSRVSVQILPLDVHGHPAMGLPFTLITLKDGAQCVYLESVRGGAYVEESEDIQAYSRVWSGLQVMSLDLDRSARMIGRIAHEHRSAEGDDDGLP